MDSLVATLKCLSKAELLRIIPPKDLTRQDRRSREDLDRALTGLPAAVRARLLEAAETKSKAKTSKSKSTEAIAKATLKRKRDAETKLEQRKARRTEEQVRDTSKFMDLPTHQERKERQEAFRDRTNNKSLQLAVCVSCARELGGDGGGRVRLLDIPNRSKLIPAKPHPAHRTWREMLLVTEVIDGATGDEASGWLCKECQSALEADKLPALALVNQMWIGDIPEELRALTIPEQMLIAIHFPRCFVFKLFPKRGGTDSVDPESLQSGMRSNVSSYELNVDDLAKMIEGNLLPQKPEILASVLAVALIGFGRWPSHWLKSTFRVRRTYIRRALVWLKANNWHYRDLDIDEERLEGLPEDDIPEAILATMRTEEDGSLVEKEREGYVQDDDDDDSVPNAPDGSNLVLGDDGVVQYPASFGEELGHDSENEDEAAVSFETSRKADVIPLQYLGVCNTDLSKASSHDIMLHALANMENGPDSEGGYAVRHSKLAVNDFGRPKKDAFEAEKARVEASNPMTCSFPLLFPYAEGGIEANREVPVAFLAHVRWAIQYHDRRFRTHHSFPFVAFGIEQKRQALRSVKAQMLRRDFERDGPLLSKVTVEDLKIAEEEERKGQPFSNEGVKVLRKHLRAMGGKVMGSDHARAAYRPQIWGTSIMCNPPTIWMTINPVDIHDPIAQIFAGENIDMDAFNKPTGPGKDERARNIARDPYAAAKFFEFIITAVLECLFNIDSQGHHVKTEMGILGLVTAYFGVVEAQGRGTLHLHMVLWLKHSPTTEEMNMLLEGEPFRLKIATYIGANIRAHLDGFTEATIKEIPRETELAYSRPPATSNSAYEDEVLLRERAVVRAQQVHTCSKATCFKLNAQTGKRVCKRRAPFPLSEMDIIDANGRWFAKRTYGYLNNWSPDIIQALACNNDIKLLTNGKETKDCACYCTNYGTKKQQKSHNMSALLGNGIAYHTKNLSNIDDLKNRNRKCLFRCFQSLNRDAEYSGPQVIMYLMGWGDHFASHKYIAIYWSSVTALILREYPTLKQNKKKEGSEEQGDESVGPDNRQNTQNVQASKSDLSDAVEQVVLKFDPQGRISSRSQIEDYALRGEDLRDISFLAFLLDTYEVYLSKERLNGSSGSVQERRAEGFSDDEDGNVAASGDENVPDHPSKRGRRRNPRYRYDTKHPRAKTHQRMARTEGHKYLPSFVGPYFPRRDDSDSGDFYCCNILALLKPWYTLGDLRDEDQTWKDALAAFEGAAPKRTRDIISSIQYYYHCNDSAQKNSSAPENELGGPDSRTEVPQRRQFDSEDDDTLGEDSSLAVEVTDELIEELEAIESAPREARHGRTAVEIARFANIFDPAERPDWTTRSEDVGPATGNDLKMLDEWQAQMGQNVALINVSPGHEDVTDGGITSEGSIKPAGKSQNGEISIAPSITHLQEVPVVTQSNDFGQSELRTEQRRAFDIVFQHLQDTLAGKDIPQLLMQIHGEGGTGKSKVIRTITKAFEGLGVGKILARSAYTGIAASIIDGKTLHTLASIPLNGHMPSKKAIEKAAEATKGLRYLIIDEISMVSREFLAKLSRIFDMISASKGEKNQALPFGGLNVVVVGDLHQFPPVAGGKSAALYWPGNTNFDSADAIIGRQIFVQFRIAVILRQ